MPLDLTPLETLSPAVERAAGANAPAPVKMMTARGMAPLPPAELVVALYQLGFSDDITVRDASNKSAVELPDAILQSALAAALDGRVLDFYARRVTRRAKPLEVVLLNRATHDETFRHLATVLTENDLEMIAKNEERLLRSPQIIAALYMNPKTRMSTAQRVVELAARNAVRVEGIPGFDDIVKAIAGTPITAADDAAFREATTIVVDSTAGLAIVALAEADDALVAETDETAEEPKELTDDEAAAAAIAMTAGAGTNDPKAEEKAKKLTDLSPAAKIRVATLGNSFGRSVLIRDKNKQVSMACIRSPGVSDSEALKYATNRGLDDDIIRFICNQRSWTRLPAIRFALVNNPKTPMNVALRFLPLLNIRDLKQLARSKGIPAALAKVAKQHAQARGG